MDPLHIPRLRFGLALGRDGYDPNAIYVWDRLSLGGQPVRLNSFEFACLRLFDGQRTVRDIHAQVIRWVGKEVPLEHFFYLVTRLDDALLLDGARFQERARHPIREPVCIGCYEGEPERLRRQLHGLFTHPNGPGVPSELRPDGSLRAALVPHIDYLRGGPCFAWGFKEVFERTRASLFVIVGTSHYSRQRFTLTRKHFRTPLGIAQTDQDYIDRLVAHYGDGLFDDELQAHLPEHSVELEVVFLQYLYEGKRPIRIVPLVVGSFHDYVTAGRQPLEYPDIGRMIAALRRVEAEMAEPICYIISGDLAHIGPKFDDPDPVDEAQLTYSLDQDQSLLARAAMVDAKGYFDVIAAEGDERRICGLPPTYTVLEAIRPHQGALLNYDRFIADDGYESVSFASMAFYGRMTDGG